MAVYILICTEDLGSHALRALREDYSNSKNFCDGDIYRNIRYHQRHCQEEAVGKWLARLSETKRRDLLQLQKMAVDCQQMSKFQDALDDLIPYSGLWSALQIGTFHRLLTLRCPEVLPHAQSKFSTDKLS